MKVEWRPSALDDRDAIIEYLEPLNPHAAVNLLQALILAGDSLTLFPAGAGGRNPRVGRCVAISDRLRDR